MKISLNWIKEYTEINISLEQLVQKIGGQLGAVEEVIDISKKYQGILVAKVVSCQKHPTADRLSVCKIDDGKKFKEVARDENGFVQVVCGAPNVKAGLTVAWIPPGATVPSTYGKDPLVLDARELRGEVSNGMLASSKELDIGNDHDGIIELNEASPGANFAEEFGLDDAVIDIENKMFTHRPDCFGILGVAREIAGIQNQKFESPSWYLQNQRFSQASKLSLKVVNELPDLVPRFMAVAMENVEVKPSPLHIQIALSKIGIKPINNIVDATNYMMYLTAQPLHAYDYDKVASLGQGGAELAVRHPSQNEKVQLLNGKTIEPKPNVITIATGKELIGLGGVMGGAGTEVDKNTKNIILECANFDMYSVRRASMAHGLFTDAVTRFNKGQSPLQNDKVMAQTMELLTQLSGARQASDVIDNQPNELKASPEINTTAEFVNQRLGLNLNSSQMKELLKNVEFKVQNKDEELKITPPFWRTDIEIGEDLVEEVGRLYGYEKLPLVLPRRTSSAAKIEKLMPFKSDLRTKLAGFGANELLNYSFVHGDLLNNVHQKKELAFKISNALSPELQYYRMSLVPSILTAVHPNIKAGYKKFMLFEIGKSHNKLHKDDDNGVPKEYDMLAAVYANKDGQPGSAFYQAKNNLSQLAKSLKIDIDYKKIEKLADFPVVQPFDLERSALAFEPDSGIALGIVGEFKSSVRQKLKLPQGTAGYEIGINELLTSAGSQTRYRPLSRFPSISQDLCLQVKNDTSFGTLAAALKTALTAHLSEDEVIDVEPLDIYSSNQLNSDKRITFRIKLTSYSRTLTEEVLSGLLSKAAAELSKSLGAQPI